MGAAATFVGKGFRVLLCADRALRGRNYGKPEWISELQGWYKKGLKGGKGHEQLPKKT